MRHHEGEVAVLTDPKSNREILGTDGFVVLLTGKSKLPAYHFRLSAYDMAFKRQLFSAGTVLEFHRRVAWTARRLPYFGTPVNTPQPSRPLHGSAMKIIGVILVILGIIGFVTGGFSFTQDREVADLGPLEIETEETRTVPIAPIASGAAVVAGIALIAIGSMKKGES